MSTFGSVTSSEGFHNTCNLPTNLETSIRKC